MKKLLVAMTVGLLLAGGAEAATFYTAKTGSDSHSCTQTQSQSTPKLTINAGLRCLSAGDTLLIKAGTYAEIISSPPSGTSWTIPVTVSKFGTDTVIVNSAGSGTPPLNLWSPSVSYVIFDGLIFDAANTGLNTVSIGNGANHIRLLNCEIKNAVQQGVQTLPGSDGNQFINCSIHDNGTHQNYDHGLYISSANNLVERNLIYDNAAYGIHIYTGGSRTAGNNVVRNNVVYANNRLGGFAFGMILTSGDGNIAYNNIVRDNPSGGIQVGSSTTNTKIYNNTIYNNSGAGIQIDGGTGTVVKNNIVHQNATGILNSGSGSVISNNLTANPQFKSAANADLSVQAGSSAIDAGVEVGEVKYDFNGVARPQGCCYDIGALEYGSSAGLGSSVGPVPSAPSNLSVNP
jgi:parallel beta-helix repeat protein